MLVSSGYLYVPECDLVVGMCVSLPMLIFSPYIQDNLLTFDALKNHEFADLGVFPCKSKINALSNFLYPTLMSKVHRLLLNVYPQEGFQNPSVRIRDNKHHFSHWVGKRLGYWV